MEKGIALSFNGARLFKGLCVSLASSGPPGASVVVGEDRTSCSLAGGSFLFSFQIAVEDQGKEVLAAGPQPAEPLIFGLAEG